MRALSDLLGTASIQISSKTNCLRSFALDFITITFCQRFLKPQQLNMSSSSSSHMNDDAEALAEAADGFFLAAEHGRSDVLKALADHAQGKLDLSRIVDPATGRTPLHVAVANGKTDAVRVLLAAGFPPDHESLPAASTSSSSSNTTSPDKRTNTAYLLAKQLRATDLVFVFHQFAIQQIAANSVAGVEQLLRAGVDIDTTDGAARNTFVHWAVTCSASDVLARLLARTDVQQTRVMDRVNADGATPLHLACRANNIECARLLLRAGADPTVKGERGAFLNKTARELATAPEIAALFTAEAVAASLLSRSSGGGDRLSTSERSSRPSDASVDSVAPSTAGAAGNEPAAASPLTPAVETRRPSHSDKDASSARLLLQLEEKDVLVAQLRKTIESLVVEAQEIRKLGDERVVLDYVRKLREVRARAKASSA